jgi:predicted dehydrogenase
VSTGDRVPHRLGLVGCGAFGTFLADAIAEHPHAIVAAVADTNTASAARLAASHAVAAIATDLDGLLAHDDIDIVVVATPPFTHAALTVQALEAGRHVLVEKPLAIDLGGCRQIAAAANRAGRVVAVDHLLRFAPLVTALARLLKIEVGGRRVLGPIRRFAFENDAADEDLPFDHWFWDPGRSGGIFIEHGVHFFDLAANLIGSPAEAIQAMATTRPDGRTDTVCATASYHNGSTATWYHSFTHTRQGQRQSLRLDLGNGHGRLEGWIPLELLLDIWTDAAGAEALHAATIDALTLSVPEHQVSIAVVPPAQRSEAAAPMATHHVRIRLGHGEHAKQTVYANCIRHLLTDLLAAIDHARPPRVNLDAASDAVAVAAAATEATRTGSTLQLATTRPD